MGMGSHSVLLGYRKVSGNGVSKERKVPFVIGTRVAVTAGKIDTRGSMLFVGFGFLFL